MAVSGPMWVKEGSRVAADAVVKTVATPEILEIFLFSNDATITVSTVNADLTEVTTNGGEKVTLAKATWDASTDADPVVSNYNSTTGVVWTITGALTVYGWAVRGVTSTKIYAAENWGVTSLINGNTLTCYPLQLKFNVG